MIANNDSMRMPLLKPLHINTLEKRIGKDDRWRTTGVRYRTVQKHYQQYAAIE